MAKKKKTQLRPVARGFATTSVPKKPPQPPPELPNVDNRDDVERPLNVERGVDEALVAQGSGTGGQSLQYMVDKVQEKTEKEITRTIKAVEADRRFSKILPLLTLDQSLADRIISLALESEGAEGKKSFQEPKDKAIVRLGITYGVLRRLGFSEARVEECLRAMPGVDLDEAYEWLCLHCTEEELEDKRVVEASEPKPHRTAAHRPASRTIRPRTPAESLAATKPKVTFTPSVRLDANAPIIPSRPLLSQYPAAEDQSDVDFISLNGDFDSGPESLDTDDLAFQYARLRLQHDKVMSSRKTGHEALTDEVHELDMRLHALKSSYFFDEQEAEEMYQLERHKVHERALQDQLRGMTSLMNTCIDESIPSLKRPPELQSQISMASATTPDIFDDDSGDSTAGGVFELLDIMPTTETDAQGKTTTIRDMAMPKHWSGRTPKMLLVETVAMSDRYAAIEYRIISRGSRARRADVSIRWVGKKMDEWLMEDVACYDNEQAEQYIATVALHALTFPPTDGFAGSVSTFPGSHTFFRLLPAVFRDLWNELEEMRKARDDKFNRDVWAKLLSILEYKMGASDKPNEKTVQPVLHTRNIFSPTVLAVNTESETLSEQLATSFRLRQASASYQEMLVQRNLLPIAQYREEVVQQLEQSQVLVLSGETGCGKSTQVPAFILEDQLCRGRPCRIYCTEPRRISAVSLAQRVSRELGDAPNAVGTANSLVGYSIRLESSVSRNTRLAFVTNGIALRMLEGGTGYGGQGTAFDEITHIIIDEVHERTIESDFLLIVLKTLMEQRSDLKVILMSATVDADKISSFFGGCPVIHVPGRTFPVDVKFLEDAVEYTKWSISEFSPYAKRVHDKFYRGKNRPDWIEETPAGEDDDDNVVQENVKLEKRYSSETAATINILDERLIPYDLILRLLERICFDDPSYASYSSAVLIFMPGLAEIRRLSDLFSEHPAFGSNDFKIYPLHSMLSNENQSSVFDIPPSNVRKIVIATNIAETGITIPDITCVIDSGKHREMRFDEKRQISRLVETFVAKSNAAQRRGRAGRVQRGLCFHLFTKVRHDTQMADHPLPEMMRLSLSDLALRIKIMKVRLGSSIEDVLSRALDPPVSTNVQRAISMLVEVRALTPSEEITPMGRLLSTLPTDVHLGKFLLTATLFRCLDPALTIAAALNSRSPFVSPFGFEQEADRAKNSFRVENSDFLTIHNAFASWRRASTNPGTIRKFCRTNYLSHQNLQQIEELRQQFLGYLIDSSFIHVDKSFIRELSRARYSRHRTRFVTIPPELDVNSGNSVLVNAALTAGLFPKVLAVDQSKGQMRTISNNHVSFHPSSVNFGRKPTDFNVNHLAYFTLMHSKKLYAWETGPVDDLSLILLCGECDFKLISDSTFIDRKIKFHISPKSNVALKILRSQLGSLLAHQFRGKALNESQTIWNNISLLVLGKMKIEDEAGERSVMIN